MPDTIEPTWDTRPDDRTVYFDIPAPRGQITDRNGLPLAQSRLGYHLDLSFPTGEEMSDAPGGRFRQAAARRWRRASCAVRWKSRPPTCSTITTTGVCSRWTSPFTSPRRRRNSPAAKLSRATSGCAPCTCASTRTARWPRTSSATAARPAARRTGPLQPNELLWPDLEGREGLEKTYNEQLTGHHGVLNMTFNGKGEKTSERIVTPPIPGNNVVTTLDLPPAKTVRGRARQGCQARRHRHDRTRRRATCSRWPPGRRSIPNLFVPSISEANFRRINEDPNIPLIPARLPGELPGGIDLQGHRRRGRAAEPHHRQGRRVQRSGEHAPSATSSSTIGRRPTRAT